MNLEILNFGEDRCEVWDQDGFQMFEGSLLECEDFVMDYEVDDAEDSEFD